MLNSNLGLIAAYEMNHQFFPWKEPMLRNEPITQTSVRVDATFRTIDASKRSMNGVQSHYRCFKTKHEWFKSHHRLKPRFDAWVTYDARMPRAMRIDPDAERFGAILKQLREQRGWTRLKLAQRSGVTPTYIGILEYGGNVPSLPMVLELIEVLGADIGEVMRRLAAARVSPPTA